MAALNVTAPTPRQSVAPSTYSFEVARAAMGTTPVTAWSGDDDAFAEPLHFERRRLPRKKMSGYAIAVFTSGDCVGTVVRVELVDASHTGIGVICPMPIEPGAAFTLIPEDARMPRCCGIAVRCRPHSDESDSSIIGLRMTRSRAAA
jgi:hypothetical protein